MIDLGHGFSFPQKFWNCRYQGLFPEDLLSLLGSLLDRHASTRKTLLERREARARQWNEGELPEFCDRNSEMIRGDWKVAPLPKELLRRRVEITGPVNSAKMVINMLKRQSDGSRADMAMLDFEDSMKPSFQNVLDGYTNVMGAVKGDLSYEAADKVYK